MKNKPSYDELEKRIEDLELERRFEHDRMMNILDSIPYGVYIVNRKYSIQYINSVIENELGPIKERKCYEYFHGRTDVCPWCKEEVFTGKSVHWEYHSLTSDKHYHVFDMPLENLDGSISKFSILHDISDLKKNQELLRAKMHDLGERVKELNCLYSIADIVNEDYLLEEILQRTTDLIPLSLEYPELVCSNIIWEGKEFKTENFTKTVWKQAADILVHGKPSGTLEVCYLEERPEKDKGPFIEEERELINSVAKRLGKIIERKLAEERVKKLENIIRSQDKMTSLGRVAAGIAHEIRNPLSGINIYLRTLEKITANHKAHEKVTDILSKLQSASNKIESVIKRVMDFSKPSEPKFTLIDINRPVQEAFNLSSVTLRKSGVQIFIDLSVDIPQCNADPQLIEQVVLNLVTNASEAMQHMDNGKKITISSFRENNAVCIRVCDSGPGVPNDILNHILDPFYTTKNDSSGIGLTICNRIVTDHGGSIDISTSEFGGAEFSIRIPTHKQTGEK